MRASGRVFYLPASRRHLSVHYQTNLLGRTPRY